MKLFDKDLETEVVYVAEIGVNHEGGLDYAKDLLKSAAQSGADAVKFQGYTPERYASASNVERLARVSKFALSAEQYAELVALAKELNVHIFSTPLTEDWVDILDPTSDVFKIASGDITFEAVIRAAAKTQKPVIISTGVATLEEIDQAVAWVKDEIGDAALKDRLVIMQCICAYPAPLDQANVRGVPFLQERYGVYVGYSNHIVEAEACYAAIALGAPVIEVHFTDKKTGRDFHDHALSFEPEELKQLIAVGNRIKASLGSYDKIIQPCELDPQLVRKGVVAANDLTDGHVLSRDDLMFARPATEILSGDVLKLVGKKIGHAYKKGEQIKKSELNG
ncbi:MAG: hypothetical protein COB14_09050 [Alphaproteobacteria bacterium]|nr:MAG: hypothetical protein COB14_09050 [Alphaproteobacteria bacterium]